MLGYGLRIRDLVHGTILFTKEEERIINHSFFQRLRQIRQNDVAFYVYPSMNTSRFEHTLGVCRVAGMMAENLTNSPKWGEYLKQLKQETGIKSKVEFVKVCRFYALLHDIGHFPLSHLFEYALEGWSGSMKEYMELIERWTGRKGFDKLHEAFGAVITEKLFRDVKLSSNISETVINLMTEKDFSFSHPLYLIKSVIDSEIDADRIDFVIRDGLMAGGEYGHYDIRRLCDSVFIEQDETGWLIAYSEKALTSMEALLLDRYRTYQWVHFHHRVIAMKMLVKFLISEAFKLGVISKEQFTPEDIEKFSLRDDVWLWDLLRNIKSDNQYLKIGQEAVFQREKKNILNLWKTRPAYHYLNRRLAERAHRDYPMGEFGRDFRYQSYMSGLGGMDTPALTFEVPFTPVKENAVYLYSESGRSITGETLSTASKLVSNLKQIWGNEPQYYVLFIGDDIRGKAEKVKEGWVELTADWIKQPRLW